MDESKKFVQSALRGAYVDEDIVCNIPVHPAGYPEKPDLPGRKYWQSILWAHMLQAVKLKAQCIPVILRGKDGFKTEAKNNRDDINKSAAQQPVIVTTEFKETIKSAGAGEMASTKAEEDVTAAGFVFGGVVKLLLKKL